MFEANHFYYLLFCVLLDTKTNQPNKKNPPTKTTHRLCLGLQEPRCKTLKTFFYLLDICHWCWKDFFFFYCFLCVRRKRKLSLSLVSKTQITEPWLPALVALTCLAHIAKKSSRFVTFIKWSSDAPVCWVKAWKGQMKIYSKHIQYLNSWGGGTLILQLSYHII